MAKKQSLKSLVNNQEEKTAHFGICKVNRTAKAVFLDLFPGATGQSAISTVQLDGKTLLKEHIGVIEDFEIGKNRDLNSLELVIYTLVKDASSETNLTSLDMSLKGVPEEWRVELKRTVQNEGDSVGYKITILFFE